MINIERLHPEDTHTIVVWHRGKDEDFLRQWAGMGYYWPLAEALIYRRLVAGAEIFGAYRDGKFVGTIEIIERDPQNDSVLIGRYLVDPALTGKGLGTEIMNTFLDYCRDTVGAAEARLFVFDFNEGAHRCYLKCGFEETERVQRPNGWIAIGMKKTL
ncbi:MAG: GNAT family N-acetyltransferase [Ruminococcaceae bacterium]|nr:GNAT family N-acetyltransferase [Oscillospiraceae bacterium]